MNIKYLCVVAVLAIGCKANVSEPHTAANETPAKETPGGGGINGNHDESPPTFAQCAEAGWTKTKEAAGEAYDAAKPVVKEWATSAEKAYDDWKNKPADKNESEKPSEP
jgi:hypothetical protein